MDQYLARADFFLPGHGTVRPGDRLQLAARTAKYHRIKGRIERAPPAPPARPKDPPPAPRRRRAPKKDA